MATRSGEWGCMACKMARDGRARARKDGTVPVTQAEAARANAAPANTPLPINAPTAGGDSSNAGQAGGRGARRQADRARRQITPAEMQEIQAMQVRDEREEREGGEKATLQHVMLGRCGGMDVSKRDAYLSDLRCTLDELRKRVRSGGKDLQHAMAVA